MKKYGKILTALTVTAIAACMTAFNAGAEEMLSYDIMGDISGDGKFALSDMIMLQKYITGRVKLNDKQFKLADMNGDGNTDVFDAVIMKRELLTAKETLTMDELREIVMLRDVEITWADLEPYRSERVHSDRAILKYDIAGENRENYCVCFLCGQSFDEDPESMILTDGNETLQFSLNDTETNDI